MIKVYFKISTTNGAKYSDYEEVENDYIASRQNPAFLELIGKHKLIASQLGEVDKVKVKVDFGEV